MQPLYQLSLCPGYGVDAEAFYSWGKERASIISFFFCQQVQESDGEEIKAFCHLYNQLPNRKPLVVVPSSFNHMYESDLADLGVKIVIYANQLLRAAYPAMMNVATSILTHHRAKEASRDYCMKIKDIITLIPGSF